MTKRPRDPCFPAQTPRLTLTFHGIGPPRRALEVGEDQVWLQRDRFLRVLDSVVDERRVEITFDDGNDSDAEYALPALHDRGLEATFFVLAGKLDMRGYLSDAHLRELVAGGMEIGSHGMTHRSWRSLDAAAAHTEIVDAKALLEQSIGRSISKAACPFGAYDRLTLERLRRAGFDAVYTSDGGLCIPGQWLRPRNTVGPRDEPSDIRNWFASYASLPRRWVIGAKQIVKRSR